MGRYISNGGDIIDLFQIVSVFLFFQKTSTRRAFFAGKLTFDRKNGFFEAVPQVADGQGNRLYGIENDNFLNTLKRPSNAIKEAL